MRTQHPLNGPWLELRAFRTKDGHSFRSLAAAAGMNFQYLSMLERGERNPSPATIAKLALAMNIPKSVLEPRNTSGNEAVGA